MRTGASSSGFVLCRGCGLDLHGSWVEMDGHPWCSACSHARLTPSAVVVTPCPSCAAFRGELETATTRAERAERELTAARSDNARLRRSLVDARRAAMPGATEERCDSAIMGSAFRCDLRAGHHGGHRSYAENGGGGCIGWGES